MNIEKGKIKDSVKYTLWENIPSSITLAVTENYLIPLAVFLGANPKEVAQVFAIPNLLAAIALLFISRTVDLMGSRLKFLLTGIFLQVIVLSLIGLLPVSNIANKIFILILLSIALKILFNFISAVWGSLISEYLPMNKRGKYFGERNRINGIVTIISIILIGSLLSHFEKINLAYGFFIIFSFVAVCKLITFFLTNKMVDLPLSQVKENEFTFLEFIQRFKESNFVRYVLFTASITFATYLASPYFGVFMLTDLKFNYAFYTTIQLAGLIGGIIAFPIWGRHADVVGNAKILKETSLLIPLMPLFWIASQNIIFLTVVNFFCGFVWSGFNLCQINFIYDSVIPEKRIRCLAYFNLINGVALFGGSMIGGFIVEYLPKLFGYQFLSLFLISAVFRMLAYYFYSGTFKEVRREIKDVSSSELYNSIFGLRPILSKDAKGG